MRLEGEYQFGDAGNEREAPKQPGGRNEGNVRFGDTHDTEDDKENACDAKPDFSTCFHAKSRF